MDLKSVCGLVMLLIASSGKGSWVIPAILAIGFDFVALNGISRTIFTVN